MDRFTPWLQTNFFAWLHFGRTVNCQSEYMSFDSKIAVIEGLSQLLRAIFCHICAVQWMWSTDQIYDSLSLHCINWPLQQSHHNGLSHWEKSWFQHHEVLDRIPEELACANHNSWWCQQLAQAMCSMFLCIYKSCSYSQVGLVLLDA